jgi:hypothetical protein
MRQSILILTLLFLFTCTSGQRYGGQLTRPPEAAISIQGSNVDKFDAEKSITLKRYLSGNSRWEVLQENGKTYAIRKELRDGKYQTSLNGFYSNFNDSVDVLQTRVIVSFGQYFGFGRDESGITFTDTKNKNVILTVEGEHMGSPGSSSYLIIQGKNINIEIFEQSRKVSRNFTKETIAEINNELSEVLRYADEINTNGAMPVLTYYPSKIDSSYFNILDGMQPGIYIVQASLKLDKAGIVYIKAFDAKTNERLSEDRITPRTTREIGWSKDGQNMFYYESELTVYEGDWSHQYEAKFEIWFKDSSGVDKKLKETKRIINGWER